MKIEVKLFAYFRDNRFVRQHRDYPESTTVKQVIEDLSIDLEAVGVTMIGGRHCQFERELCENESLAIFPMIGGG